MLDFKGTHFPKEIILMAVRWYVAYPLSYRHVEELMKERGTAVDHATVNRWVVKYSPILEERFRKVKKRVGASWRMDETYVKIKGIWHYYYRAVDKENNTIDFYLSKLRNAKAAHAFFEKAIGSNGVPDRINIDKSGANLAALESINEILPWFAELFIRQVKYLNNIIEQDHRFIKKIVRPMLGFKAFHSADATLAGIELHNMLKKRQCKYRTNLPVWQQFYALAA